MRYAGTARVSRGPRRTTPAPATPMALGRVEWRGSDEDDGRPLGQVPGRAGAELEVDAVGVDGAEVERDGPVREVRRAWGRAPV